MVNNNFPQVDFNVAYQTPKTIGSYFPFKDKIKRDMDKSMVIYNIKCTQCNAEYIGKTDRILSIRISEHKKDENSACLHHSQPTGHVMDYENVQFIYASSTDTKLRVKSC